MNIPEGQKRLKNRLLFRIQIFSKINFFSSKIALCNHIMTFMENWNNTTPHTFLSKFIQQLLPWQKTWCFLCLQHLWPIYLTRRIIINSLESKNYQFWHKSRMVISIALHRMYELPMRRNEDVISNIHTIWVFNFSIVLSVVAFVVLPTKQWK